METNPSYYGLPSRVQLEEIGPGRLGIRRIIKSRIIRKDAAKIVDMAKQIKSVTPGLEITLICTHNICSKSLALLKEEAVEVKYVKE